MRRGVVEEKESNDGIRARRKRRMYVSPAGAVRGFRIQNAGPFNVATAGASSPIINLQLSLRDLQVELLCGKRVAFAHRMPSQKSSDV